MLFALQNIYITKVLPGAPQASSSTPSQLQPQASPATPGYTRLHPATCHTTAWCSL